MIRRRPALNANVFFETTHVGSLILLGLADVNPRHIKVAVPRRARPSLPPFVELTHVKADMRTTLYEGLRS